MKFQTYRDFLLEFTQKPRYKWNPDPKIGWWEDRKNLIFYHGTHKSNLDSMLETGIRAPTSGPTANKVSLTLDPGTANAYASMGGEAGFRAAGAKAQTVPVQDRRVLVIKLATDWVKRNMDKTLGGNVGPAANKLDNKEGYEKFKGPDKDWYMLTEFRFPKFIEPKYVIGWMAK